jgi:flagellin-like protein
MKGVSAIIAVILILMIVVALAALAYTWFTGIFTSLTGGAQTAISSTTTALGTNFRIESAKNTSATVVTVMTRNVGTVDLDMTKLSAYIDEEAKPITNQANLGISVAGNITLFTVTGAVNPNGKTLKIVTSTGLEQSATIK